MKKQIGLWIAHHEAIIAALSEYWLSLRRLVRMIAHAIENLFDLADAVFCHARFALS